MSGILLDWRRPHRRRRVRQYFLATVPSEVLVAELQRRNRPPVGVGVIPPPLRRERLQA